MYIYIHIFLCFVSVLYRSYNTLDDLRLKLWQLAPNDIVKPLTRNIDSHVTICLVLLVVELRPMALHVYLCIVAAPLQGTTLFPESSPTPVSPLAQSPAVTAATARQSPQPPAAMASQSPQPPEAVARQSVPPPPPPPPPPTRSPPAANREAVKGPCCST